MFRRLLIAAVLFSLLAIAIVGTANVEPQITGPMAYVTAPVDLKDIKRGSFFGRIDLSTGTFTSIGTTEFLVGIAQSGGNIYGIDAESNLVRIDPTNAAITHIGNTEVTTKPGPFGIVVDVFSSLSDGRLFLMDFENNLFSVDSLSGKATLVGATGIRPIKEFFLATTLAGDSNTLYFTVHEVSRTNLAVVTPPTLYRIDPLTASATEVGRTANFVFGSVFAHSNLYGFTQKSDLTGNRTNLIITINPTTGGVVGPSNTSASEQRSVPYVVEEELGSHGVLSGAEAVQ